MPAKFSMRCLIITFLFGLLVATVPFSSSQVVHAQQGEAFSIISPYYGAKQINSLFDHSAPNFGKNNIFVRYDG